MHYLMLVLALVPQRSIIWKAQGLYIPEQSQSELLSISDIVVCKMQTYVLDRSDNKIKAIDEKGDVRFAFGRTGQGPGEFLRPVRIAAINDQLWVFESEKGIVYRFDLLGNLLGEVKLVRGYDIAFYADGVVVSDIINPFLFHHFDLKGYKRNAFGQGFTATTDFGKALELECRTFVDVAHGIFFAFYTHGRYFERYDLKSGTMLNRVALSFNAYAAPVRNKSKLEGNGGAGQFFRVGGEPVKAAVLSDQFIWVLVNDELQEHVSYLAALDLEGQPLAIQRTPHYWTNLLGREGLWVFTNKDLETVQQYTLQLSEVVK